jgi:hypothetical protein
LTNRNYDYIILHFAADDVKLTENKEERGGINSAVKNIFAKK